MSLTHARPLSATIKDDTTPKARGFAAQSMQEHQLTCSQRIDHATAAGTLVFGGGGGGAAPQCPLMLVLVLVLIRYHREP